MQIWYALFGNKNINYYILYIGIPSCSSTIVITHHMICFRFSVVTQIIENPVLVIQERKKNTYKPNL